MNRDERMRRREDFRRVYETGTSFRSADVVLVCLRDTGGRPRFAAVASRKTGGAVRRNRSKRLLREAHRRMRPAEGFRGTDIVLIARRGTAERTCREIAEQLADLYRQAGLMEAACPANSGEPTDS